jgi:5-methylcytosine-specific restriction protein A
MLIHGHVYRRRDLHDQYGGQRQGGISTPSQHPFILLFTGESGEQHGYADGWSVDGLFLSTGEGQRGDMAFVRGNAAIRDHINHGRDLHLFAYVKQGSVRYLGQMVCTGFHPQVGPDTTRQLRQMIIFALTPFSAFEESTTSEIESLPIPVLETTLTLDELRHQALADAATARDPVARQTFYRQRSQWIKRYARN